MSQPVLQTRQLSIGYRQPRQPDKQVAVDLNLELAASELVCLIGPNGAGKSTLLRTLAGMQKPLAGTVCLLNDDVHSLSEAERARRLSIVLTEHIDVGLLDGYALVSLGRHPYTDWTGRLSARDEEAILWAIHALDAEALAPRPVRELSDGERQKLMIARALAQEPALMLLDEPTAFLDLPRRVEVLGLLRDLAHETGRAVLLSTHDLDLALRSADRIWLLGLDGVLQIGAPEDLVLNGAFEAVFNRGRVRFDPNIGSFNIQSQYRQQVQLTGSGTRYAWTYRALERAGYHISDAARVHITIRADAWRVSGGEQPGEHRTIAALLQALIAQFDDENNMEEKRT